MSRYVLVEVGCLECHYGTAVLAVSDDLAVIQAEWHSRHPTNRGGPVEWGERDDQDDSYEVGWPSNVISAALFGDGALVAYDMTLPIEPRSNG